MARFKARKVQKGFFEIEGLEEYIESKLAGLMQAHRPSGRKATVKKPKRAKRPVRRAVKKPAGVPPLQTLTAALKRHPRRAALVRAGKQKNQLLRSLVPLYVSRTLGIAVNSGLISKFWAAHGVRYAPPNAAKALRQHTGYARLTKIGRQITSNGIRYVESALRKAA